MKGILILIWMVAVINAQYRPGGILSGILGSLTGGWSGNGGGYVLPSNTIYYPSLLSNQNEYFDNTTSTVTTSTTTPKPTTKITFKIPETPCNGIFEYKFDDYEKFYGVVSIHAYRDSNISLQVQMDVIKDIMTVGFFSNRY
jgi:hypothetical protein